MRDTDRPQQRSNLRIDGATLRLVRLPLVTPFTIATGTLTEKVFPLLTLRALDPEGRQCAVAPRALPADSRRVHEPDTNP